MVPERSQESPGNCTEKAPEGGRQGVLHGPVRAQIAVMSQTCMCLVAQTPLLSDQIARMSEAQRWFQHLEGGRQRVGRSSVRAQILGCPRRFACLVAQTPFLSEQAYQGARQGVSGADGGSFKAARGPGGGL